MTFVPFFPNLLFHSLLVEAEEALLIDIPLNGKYYTFKMILMKACCLFFLIFNFFNKTLSDTGAKAL